jgi:hypothetical protein
MSLLISILIVIRHIFILVFERPPAVEVVPEIVELLDLLFCRIVVAQSWYGLNFAESALSYEDRVPELEEAAFLCLLFAWRLDIRSFIYGIELAAFDRVEEDFRRFLNAFEE